MARKTKQERFEAKISPEPNSGCWLWMAGGNKKGYGAFQGTAAHRASYRLFVGPIPSGMFVCHKCDVPACVNPNHLFLGTPADNTRDSIGKGRATTFRTGPLHPKTKLRAADIPMIRTLAEAISFRKIGQRFGVDHKTISDVVKGKSWKHVA